MKKTLSVICMLTILFFILISGLLTSTMYIANALPHGSNDSNANTPIKYLVILYQENISFDHYFATYPNARNLPGEPNFSPSSNTPSVNGLNSTLLNHNPNSANPVRLDRSQIVTCDMNHGYTAEQNAYHGGANKFVEYTSPTYKPCTDQRYKQQVMDYFDGNTVTALWNYAQHYAMSDNFFATTYGPSVLGHINLVSGNTHGAIIVNPKPPNETRTSDGSRIINGTIIANKDPAFDDCSNSTYSVISMEGRNIGDLLNAKNVTWGWFSAGFMPSIKTADDNKWHCSFTGLLRSDNQTQQHDYYPDVEPFQYYKNTSNPHHLPPTSVSTIGYTDQANHQYDMRYFWSAAESGRLPAVSFLKAPSYQSAHAGFTSSNPLDEQTYLVNTINRLQKTPQWKDTAIIITYDDSDGWYDHVIPPIVGSSRDLRVDRISGFGQCGNTTTTNGPFQDRCGYGPRLPFLIISPWAKANFVDHTVTDQTSIIRFIEDNWGLGRIGNNSYDSKAGSILNMLDFNIGHTSTSNLFLEPITGTSILITK